MLDDLLAPGLKLVICGTAASAVSAARGQYYAGPGNKFWPILAATGLTPERLEPGQYRELLGHGIGLTDVVKGQSGSDQQIDFGGADPESLRDKLALNQPAVLGFNGKKAAQVFLETRRVAYGLQDDHVGATSLFVLPSTSGLASGAWAPEYWFALAELVGRAND